MIAGCGPGRSPCQRRPGQLRDACGAGGQGPSRLSDLRAAGLRWEREELAVLRRFIRALSHNVDRAPVDGAQLPTDDLDRDHWSVSGERRAGLSRRDRVELHRGSKPEPAVEGGYFLRAATGSARSRSRASRQPVSRRAAAASSAAFERAVALGVGLRLKIVTPYARLTKAQVIRRGRELPLRLTVSCIRPPASGIAERARNAPSARRDSAPPASRIRPRIFSRMRKISPEDQCAWRVPRASRIPVIWNHSGSGYGFLSICIPNRRITPIEARLSYSVFAMIRPSFRVSNA